MPKIDLLSLLFVPSAEVLDMQAAPINVGGMPNYCPIASPRSKREVNL